ncbi:MAG: YaiI/YqxD family protein [Deltaproteobacteria bacterium]|nr:YaiI/YqxD family protein [Deltaproteobacteria bacterium]MBW2659333.1 YaiI/YqxD family protein [Deltaproteobacteria bacterium]
MKIWVDGDACPVVIKDILYKAADRTGVELTLVADRFVRIPPSPTIKFLRVRSGMDAADNEIVKRMDLGDLVITSDIPLAAEVVEREGFALSPRGELYSAENIRDRLSMRDFMDSLRASGVETGGPPALSRNDNKKFASQLDKLLTRYTGSF